MELLLNYTLSILMDLDSVNFGDRVEGVLLGTAVGDAIGLPREGLCANSASQLFGRAPLRHRFFFGRGMVSDDTEHTCMTAQALLRCRGRSEAFAQSLAWRLRGWLLGIPAGIGLATLKGILRLWCGYRPHRSGVHSAGNGPAMRSAVIGLYTDNNQLLRELVKASTRLTHTDPRAFEGALAVALACRYASARTAREINVQELFSIFDQNLHDHGMQSALAIVKDALKWRSTAEQTASLLGLENGVTGNILYTVPMCLFCWLNHKDNFRAAVEEFIMLGGDTDTTGAITGALAGASLGGSSIPQEWLNGIMEWPRSVRWMRALAKRLAGCRTSESADSCPLPLFWPAIAARNLLFTSIVLAHWARRIFFFITLTLSGKKTEQ
jgi:ADP-ribosylglycohydrolase